MLSDNLTKIVVWITPTLLFATHVARYTAEKRFPYPQEIILLVALLILAWITDMVIVYGIRPINDAIAFIWFFLSVTRLEKESFNYRKRSHEEFVIAGQAFDDYVQTLQEYNQTYPQSQISPPPFNVISQQVITRWLAEKSNNT